MRKEEMVNRNLDLHTKFLKRLLREPEGLDQIPPGSSLVLLPERDPKLRESNLKMAERLKQQGKAVVMKEVRRRRLALRAADIMTRSVFSVTLSTGIKELAALLRKEKISGVPVLDQNNNLVGIVTEADILARKPALNRVGSIMTTKVYTVGEDTCLKEIARILSSKKIKRVPVVRDGRVVGIVSRADVVKAMAGRRTDKSSR